MAMLKDAAAPEMLTMAGLVGKHVEGIRETVAKPVLFDLGCGQSPMPGFKGVDLFAPKPDVRADLFDDDWTFCKNGSVDMFFSSHFVEHIPQGSWDTFFWNAYRKLKAGGFFMILTPYGNSNRAWQDPDHKQIITEERYLYLSADWRKAQRLDHYPTKCNFKMLNMWPAWNADYAHGKSDEARDFARRHYWNVIDDLMVLLQKV